MRGPKEATELFTLQTLIPSTRKPTEHLSFWLVRGSIRWNLLSIKKIYRVPGSLIYNLGTVESENLNITTHTEYYLHYYLHQLFQETLTGTVLPVLAAMLKQIRHWLAFPGNNHKNSFTSSNAAGHAVALPPAAMFAEDLLGRCARFLYMHIDTTVEGNVIFISRANCSRKTFLNCPSFCNLVLIGIIHWQIQNPLQRNSWSSPKLHGRRSQLNKLSQKKQQQNLKIDTQKIHLFLNITYFLWATKIKNWTPNLGSHVNVSRHLQRAMGHKCWVSRGSCSPFHPHRSAASLLVLPCRELHKRIDPC